MKLTPVLLSALAMFLAPASTLRSADEPKRLALFCWSEYIPQDVIDEFTKETGIKVNMETFASNEEMLAKLLAGGGSYDVIQPSDYVTQGLIAEGALMPLDHAAIPNLKNIAPRFLNMAFDPGNRFTVPYMAGTVGIVVNTERIKDDITGFQDVFQPANKGKIVVVDDAREIVSWALASLRLPINAMDDANLAKAREVLRGWLPLVRVYDSDSPKTSLLNGDVAIGVIWGGEGARLLAEDKKFRWVMPREGSNLFVDNLAIPKGAKHPGNAMEFINFILRPDISKRISEEFPYLNPNLAARALLPREALENPASYPSEEELDRMVLFEDIGGQATKVDELVTSLKVQ